jgi:hypothetical protein
VALSSVLLVWYRVRLALPAPFGGYRLLQRRVGAKADPGLQPGPEESTRVARIAGLFRQAAENAVAGQSCAPRALALARLLTLHGVPAEVRIGMRRTDEGFGGHAWVEHRGTVVGDQNDFVSTFAPLLSGRPPRLQGAK